MRRIAHSRWTGAGSAWLSALLGFAGAAALANDCGGILPRDATATTGFYLCGDGTDARDKRFACRDYLASERTFRILFRGGTAPSQIYLIARNDAAPTRLAVAGQRCEQAPPADVPAAAQYRGTGVCSDEHGRPLPCSLFEHAGARQPEAMRYFVFYEPGGSGIRRIDTLSAGRNEHALEAELVFHLGQAQTDSACCRDRARDYLARAAALFPDDGAYRAALTAQLGEGAGVQSAPMAAFSRMLDSSP